MTSIKVNNLSLEALDATRLPNGKALKLTFDNHKHSVEDLKSVFGRDIKKLNINGFNHDYTVFMSISENIRKENIVVMLGK